MLIAALVTISKLWNQPKCHQINEWSKKWGRKRNSAIKNELMSFAGKWMEVYIIMVSENFFLSLVDAKGERKHTKTTRVMKVKGDRQGM
jgi:hypothetical protein